MKSKNRSSLPQLKKALKGTTSLLKLNINRIFKAGVSIDDDVVDELEEIMISADIGVSTTEAIIQIVRNKVKESPSFNSENIKEHIRKELLKILNIKSVDISNNISKPHIIMMVGANGVGKTTTIGKLAYYYQQEGYKVLLSAADTFRAAAIEQLQILAEQAGAALVKHKPKADPGAVVFDSITAAKARNYDIVIIDTAGRLHTKHNLMNELEKIRNVINRQIKDAPHEVLLVIDATIGQNAIVQAEEFLKFSGVNGIILAKLDGTAKGGVVVAIAKQFGIPIKYVGTGESLSDLIKFYPVEFIEALLNDN
jgi:fused signal recognition particle receptor